MIHETHQHWTRRATTVIECRLLHDQTFYIARHVHSGANPQSARFMVMGRTTIKNNEFIASHNQLHKLQCSVLVPFIDKNT